MICIKISLLGQPKNKYYIIKPISTFNIPTADSIKNKIKKYRVKIIIYWLAEQMRKRPSKENLFEEIAE